MSAICSCALNTVDLSAMTNHSRQGQCEISGFDGAKTRVKARNGPALLFRLLRELGTNAFKGISNGGVFRRRILVAVVNFSALTVCADLSGLVHSRFH